MNLSRETRFKFHYKIIEGALKELKCTICKVDLKLGGDSIKKHPVLEVAICNNCFLSYQKVSFNSNALCAWCGQSDDFKNCERCNVCFCKKCLLQNLGQNTNTWDGKWICLKCNSEPIWTLRAMCDRAMEYGRRRRASLNENCSQEIIKETTNHSHSTGCLHNENDDIESLQEFLGRMARYMEALILESKENIEDFKKEVLSSYTSQISQINIWISFIWSFLNGIEQNVQVFKEEIIKEMNKMKIFGLIQLSDLKDFKSNEKRDTYSLETPTLSLLKELDSIPLPSTSKSNFPKAYLSLSLNKRKQDSSDDISEEDILVSKLEIPVKRCGKTSPKKSQRKIDDKVDANICEGKKQFLQNAEEEEETGDSHESSTQNREKENSDKTIAEEINDATIKQQPNEDYEEKEMQDIIPTMRENREADNFDSRNSDITLEGKDFIKDINISIKTQEFDNCSIFSDETEVYDYEELVKEDSGHVMEKHSGEEETDERTKNSESEMVEDHDASRGTIQSFTKESIIIQDSNIEQTNKKYIEAANGEYPEESSADPNENRQISGETIKRELHESQFDMAEKQIVGTNNIEVNTQCSYENVAINQDMHIKFNTSVLDKDELDEREKYVIENQENENFVIDKEKNAQVEENSLSKENTIKENISEDIIDAEVINNDVINTENKNVETNYANVEKQTQSDIKEKESVQTTGNKQLNEDEVINDQMEMNEVFLNEEITRKIEIDGRSVLNKGKEELEVKIEEIKEEIFDVSTDELEKLSESEISYENPEEKEEVQKALTQLVSEDVLFSSDLETESSDDEDSSSDAEVLKQKKTKLEDKVPGQIVTLPLPEIIIENSLLTKEDVQHSDSIIQHQNAPDLVTKQFDNSVKEVVTYKECFVILERLSDYLLSKHNAKVKRSSIEKEDTEISRLTNLDSLKKRRHSRSSSPKIKRKCIKFTKPSEETASAESVGEDEIDTDEEKNSDDGELTLFECENPQEPKEALENINTDDILAEILRYEVASDSSDDLFTESDDTEEGYDSKSKIKTLKNDIKQEDLDKKEAENEGKGKYKEGKKMKESSKWKNDSLLRKNFNILSDLEERKKVSERHIPRKNNNDSDLTDSEKDEGRRRRRKVSIQVDTNEEIKEEEKTDDEITPIKTPSKSRPVFIVSSSDDSDIEFISEKMTKRRKIKSSDKSSTSENEEGDAPKKKGRKNIRAIISDETLDERTKRAIEEEKQRKERVSQKQKQLNTILSQSSDTSEKGFILDIDEESKEPLIVINYNLTKRLKSHQVEGVKFMWTSCYESVDQIEKGNPGSGCILAHCMGLGKTFQVITLIHTLFNHEVTNTKHVLVVCPLSTVLNWKNEFDIAFKVASNSRKNKVFLIGDQHRTKDKKFEEIKRWHKKGGIFIMGYEAYTSTIRDENCSETMKAKIKKALVDPGPDLVILDEGHLLKNGKNIRTSALMKIKTRRRIILTGTPLQNNLREYYYMVNFVKPNLLGNYLEYSNQFVNPIVNGQYDDSTSDDVKQMKFRSHVLHKKLKGTIQRFGVSELESYLPSKLDYVLFIQLHPIQIELYKAYLAKLTDDEIRKGKLFLHLRHLQNIWTHPQLLYLEEKVKKMVKNKKIKEFDTINLDPEVQESVPKSVSDDWWLSICPNDINKNIDYGPKFKVMLSIIEECIKVGDKVVIFSNSLTELDCIEYFLKLCGTPSCKIWRNKWEYLRMDGTLKPECRVSLCNAFNNPKNKITKVFLVSHKVGGLGLNLVAANRVILMDVNWNPAYDSQSIFRIYRFGQKNKCYVYRLVSMGTVEEVVYERSVTKLAIAGRVVDQRQITRHYKSVELHKMYRANFCLTQQRPPLNVPEDTLLGKVYQKHTKEIFKYHLHQSLLENLPHESLTEEEMQKAWDEFGKENEAKARQLELQKMKSAAVGQIRRLPSYQKRIEEINNMTDQILLPSITNVQSVTSSIINPTFPIANTNFICKDNFSTTDVRNPAFDNKSKSYFSTNNSILPNPGNINTIVDAKRYMLVNNLVRNKVNSNKQTFSTQKPSGNSNINSPSTSIIPPTSKNKEPSTESAIEISENVQPEENVTLKTLKPAIPRNKGPVQNSLIINGGLDYRGSTISTFDSNKMEPAGQTLVQKETVPMEVIDVEQEELLSKLAQNSSISVSHILKPKPQTGNSLQTASTTHDSRVKSCDVILIE